jgi:hypothetical protein
MRISIQGESLSAKAIRTMLALEGLAITNECPQFVVFIGETVRDIPVVDGVDSEVERKIVNQIANLAQTAIYLQRPGGVQSDQAIGIELPKFEPAEKIQRIEIAVVNAIVQTFKPNPPPIVKQSTLSQPQIIYVNPPAQPVLEVKPWYKFW